MNTLESLDEVFSELVRRGLPADYARRAVAELKDHSDDLAEELRAGGMTDAQARAEAAHRLGDPRELTKKTVREYQRRYWCARWPLLTFLLGPIPLLFLAWAATMVLAGVSILLPLYLLGFNVDPPHDGVISTGEYVMNYVYIAWNLFAMPAVVMFVLARLGSRAALGPGWVCLSAAVLAVFVGLWVCEFPGDIKPIDRVPPADEFMVVIGLPMAESWKATWNWYTRDALHIAQFLLPLALAAWFIFRHKRAASRSAQLNSVVC